LECYPSQSQRGEKERGFEKALLRLNREGPVTKGEAYKRKTAISARWKRREKLEEGKERSTNGGGIGGSRKGKGTSGGAREGNRLPKYQGGKGQKGLLLLLWGDRRDKSARQGENTQRREGKVQGRAVPREPRKKNAIATKVPFMQTRWFEKKKDVTAWGGGVSKKTKEAG